MIVYLNGSWLNDDVASIPINDRGFLLADGVFETARLVGGKYFRLKQHLDRLRESAAQLQLMVPSDHELIRIFHEIAMRNALREASLRITITRGSGGRGLDTKGAGPQTVLVTMAPMAADWPERAQLGWTLVTAKTRRPSPESVPAQLKALGRAYSILAHLEAEAAGADDALLLSADGFIAEGPTWNFFWRRGMTIRTAALDLGVLEGVTRSILLSLAAERGYKIEEGRWAREELDGADEAFASMTSTGVVPIRSLDGKPFPADDCSTALQQAYWDFVMSEQGAS
ncbi:MAG TPA: aminotransferase class IV [Longimicrobiales bacterium]|nr:aminotransferase class IV [Longimicrobiales bacterium]